MYATKSIALLASMVACTVASAVDSNSLFGLSDGLSIAGVVVRDVHGVERRVDYHEVAHLMPRQDFCGTSTVYDCGATPPATSAAPVTTANPGGPAESAPATETTAAPPASSGAAGSSVPAGSAPAASSTIIAGTTPGTTAAATSTVASASESAASPTSAAPSAATTSALPENNAGTIVDTNMAAALVVGFAVAALI